MPILDNLKSELRKIKLSERNQLNCKYRKEASEKVVNSLREFLKSTKSENIALFYPINSEIDIIDLSQTFKGNVLLPCVVDKDAPLVFKKWNLDEQALEKKAFGVFEPNQNSDVMIPDVIIVPFLAFDGEGYRLGYGGGYYDRTISGLRNEKDVLTIGVGFDVQKALEIPHDVFDMRLDLVITEANIYKFDES